MQYLVRPGPFDVEELLNQFVIDCNGSLVSDLLPKNHPNPNADYVFKQNNVIAELKCFQKDLFNTKEDEPKIDALIREWKNKGYLNNSRAKRMLRSGRLPSECYRNLVKSAEKTIDRALHYAEKQIRETKISLGMPQAKGLVFLCNDGNYFLSNVKFLSVIADIMVRKYDSSSIDGFIYITINQVARSDKDEKDHTVWFPMFKSDLDQTHPFWKFVIELGETFITDFFPKKTGIQSNLINMDNDRLYEELINLSKLKYLPKKIAYKINPSRL